LHRNTQEPWGRHLLFWMIALVIEVVAGALGYSLWPKGKLPPPEPFLAPSETLRTGRDVSFDNLAFYPDGSWLVSGHGAADIVVWDLTSGKKVDSLPQDNVSDDCSKIYEERERRKRERQHSLEQLGTVLAATPAGLCPALAPLCLKQDPFGQLRRQHHKPGTLGSVFICSTFRDPGFLSVVNTANGPLVIGFTAVEFSWDKKFEKA